MQTDERWMPVPDAENYEVSDRGRVRSLPHTITKRDGRSMRVPARMLNPGGKKKYLRVEIRGRKYYVHELVLLAFRGPRPTGAEGCHGNGNSRDNRLANLRWDTRSENMRDRVRHGTHHQSTKTECPRGHALIAGNLVMRKEEQGARECLACSKEYFAARYAGRPFDAARADEVFASLVPAK